MWLLYRPPALFCVLSRRGGGSTRIISPGAYSPRVLHPLREADADDFTRTQVKRILTASRETSINDQGSESSRGCRAVDG